MPDKIPHTQSDPSYFSRVANHEASKRGLAGALAGVLIAAMIEALWPSP